MSFSLKGKVALVTGSSRGLGRGIARTLGLAGAKIALNYLNDKRKAQEAFEELKENRVHAMLILSLIHI